MAPMVPDIPPESVLTGRRFDVYELHELIGAGGMGEVYRATDTTLHRAVAVKVLPKLLRLDVDRVARLHREAQLLAALNHPNIATIHGFQDAGGIRALILELVEGPTLAERLDGGPATVHEAVACARQIAQGLKAAHERAIIHRDLKPANIKLRPDGVIKHPPFDIGLFPADGRGQWSPLLQSDAAEVNPVISPAGNWIAYSSNQSGRFEVYIERFPELGARQMASKGGGIEPVWAPDGKEIFYRSADGLRMLSVAFDSRSGTYGDPVTVLEDR